MNSINSLNVEDYYDDMSDVYDCLVDKYSWNIKSWIPSIEELQGSFILDVACGTGYLGELIQPYDNSIVLHGCDISDNMLNAARDKDYYKVLYKHDLSGIWPREVDNTVKRNKFKIPVGLYDYAFCFGAFGFLKVFELLRAIKTIFNQLIPKGKFIFNTQRTKHPFIKEIIPHDLQFLLTAIQDWCYVDRVDPVTAYTFKSKGYKIPYLIWHTTKK